LQRYAAWILERTAAGIEAGLSGEDLQRDVRAAYDGGVAATFGFRVYPRPGFLEDAVGSVEEAANA
jgi:hypothetical protein